jgi:hypothetical protein
MAAISGSLAPWEILPLLVILITVLPIVGYKSKYETHNDQYFGQAVRGTPRVP